MRAVLLFTCCLIFLQTYAQVEPKPGFYSDSILITSLNSDNLLYNLNGSASHFDEFPKDCILRSNRNSTLSFIPTNNQIRVPGNEAGNEFVWYKPTSLLPSAHIFTTKEKGDDSFLLKSYSYFINTKKHTFPIVSIVTDSLNLFSLDSGIYVPGKHFDTLDFDWSGNYYQRGRKWERRAHFEYFDTSGTLLVSQTIGIRIHGQKSRMVPQKSLTLFARDEYGKKNIKADLFNNSELKKFKRLVLRTPYTYYWGRNTLMQDEFIHAFVSKNFNIETEAQQAVVVYINGEYWGVQHLREKSDEHYIQEHFNIPSELVDVVYGNTSVESGSNEEYKSLCSFFETKNLELEENYEKVKQFMDIENYIDYLIVELFFGNTDWPGNNVKVWKSKMPGSKWRWIIHDMDGCLQSAEYNTFQVLQHEKISEIFLDKLLMNASFKREFIQRFQIALTTIFTTDKLVHDWTQFQEKYAQEVMLHTQRWNNPSTFQEWTKDCSELRSILANRTCYVNSHLNMLNTGNYTNDCDGLKTKKSNFIYSAENKNLTFTIDSNIDQGTTLQIINLMGISLFEYELSGHQASITLPEIAEGLYLAKVCSYKECQTQIVYIKN